MFKPASRDIYRHLEIASILLFVGATLALLVFAPSSTAVPAPSSEGPLPDPLASAMPNQGWAPLSVYFSAYGSTVPSGGTIVRYRWELDGNGSLETDATAEQGYVSYTYTKPGDYTITLEVTDDQGHTATDTVLINVRHPASSSVDYWTVFDDSQVRRIDIQITQANWDLMWEDPPAKVEVRADAVIFGEPLDDIGFSMRGQFSLNVSRDKKPWEIDTNQFIEGQEFHNLRRLLFINNIGDPTLLGEKLSYEMMHFAGVPASHTCFVEMWIDIVDDGQPNTFWGVYTMVERVDRKFLANRFGRDSDHGNLYKASHAQRGPMDLIYYGPSIEDYPTQGGSYAYGKATNEEENDYSDIVQLCYVIDGVEYETPEEFASSVEQVLNVDGYLRYLAVVMTLSNWDIYPYTGNNYYLYNNPSTGRFEWIPWDLSWGGDAEQPLFRLQGPQLFERAPLYDRVFEVERYRRQYAAYLDLLSREWFNYDHVYQRTQALHDLIAPYVTQSTGDKVFFGENPLFPIESFEDSWSGMASFAQRRSEYILTSLAQGDWQLEPQPSDE
jgi:PKD repeat protein